ncbi:hypothetical protein NGM99_07045 [Mesorhizobium sp. RP14(2022)]|uniref:DUF6538 domain-containing protein n=1 Tax=Mesorhizobium liriopis TaxID=2953882 RepID=A0ABT1C5U8_9HYPH|nr:DUF6538 domain-containing protein [Mesorhizobium liriopis]MCO6049546.1 hypothetical protein [Mesorhizobium liriopis]
MSRPFKHPRTGIYWLQKRVPQDLVSTLGRKEVTQSLGTRDPAEAKRKLAIELAELESQWADLRSGSRSITNQIAHALAAHSTIVGQKSAGTIRANNSRGIPNCIA